MSLKKQIRFGWWIGSTAADLKELIDYKKSEIWMLEKFARELRKRKVETIKGIPPRDRASIVEEAHEKKWGKP